MMGPFIEKHATRQRFYQQSDQSLYIPGEANCPLPVTSVYWRPSAMLPRIEWLWPEDLGAQVVRLLQQIAG